MINSALYTNQSSKISLIGILIILFLGFSNFMDNSFFHPKIIKVGWWNIRNLSDASRTDSEIELIAKVIRELDVIVIGELNDRYVLDRISSVLGEQWDWAVTNQKIGRSQYSAEYYGFLWNSQHLSIIDSIHIDTDPNDQFDRDPAWVSFRSVSGEFDFTLIGVHVTWGKKGVNPRKAEILALPEVWKRTQLLTKNDNDLILMGDFNRNINCKSFDLLLSLPGLIRANIDTMPTHISSNTTYDQIFLSEIETTEWTGKWGVINFDELFFNNDDAKASLTVSDHRPIWIQLDNTIIDYD
jgi:endonuclease/exonuclease/phosphatase family metal-dependent hydrolase